MSGTTDSTDVRSPVHIDWIMNGHRWDDLFFNLPDGTSHAQAIVEAERRLPLFKRGYRQDEHEFGYSIVGATDQPADAHVWPTGA